MSLTDTLPKEFNLLINFMIKLTENGTLIHLYMVKKKKVIF